jgi:two-component system, cell cycle response regulator
MLHCYCHDCSPVIYSARFSGERLWIPFELTDIMSIADNNRPASNPAPTVPLGGTMRIEARNSAPDHRPGTRAFLSVIRSRADIGVHVFIDGPTTLGRDPLCKVPLHDFGVSRQHARITPDENGDYILEDLRSTNGTRVDGIPITVPRILKDGEKIFIGDTVLRFALADEMEIDFHSEVATLVSTDPLTGLPSKRRFDQAMEFALQDARHAGSSLALLMMDMDGVKQINDTHGHLFGAHVIGETGKLIAQVLGTNGRACRFGGDEFSAFLPGYDLAAACQISERIRSVVETAGMEKDGIPLRPTISIGVACYPDAGDELLELVAMADKALYRAKEQGKNRVAH